MRVHEQVAIVTGAVGGIGSAIVRTLVKEGASVGLIDYDAKRGQQLEDELLASNYNVKYVNTNVAHFDACESAVAQIVDELGEPEILVNNVGISPKTKGQAARVWEMSPAEWDSVVAVNLSSAFYMTRLVTPYMIKKHTGRIINMSSVAGETYCDIVAAHYAATKAALIGATRHWAGELGEYNVTVNALAPGRINTPLLATVPHQMNDAVIDVTALKRLGKPEEVADACLFFVSDKARFVTGQVLDVAGGWLMS